MASYGIRLVLYNIYSRKNMYMQVCILSCKTGSDSEHKASIEVISYISPYTPADTTNITNLLLQTYFPKTSSCCGPLLTCFGVRVSVKFHLTCVYIILVRFRLLNGHLFENSCSLG